MAIFCFLALVFNNLATSGRDLQELLSSTSYNHNTKTWFLYQGQLMTSVQINHICHLVIIIFNDNGHNYDYVITNMIIGDYDYKYNYNYNYK
jgi:hypothetical protein